MAIAGGAPPAGVRMSTVYVLAPGSETPHAVRIRAGITDGTLTEIVEGALDEGTRVVVGETSSNAKPAAPTNPLGGTPRGGGPRRGR
jgi:hypothetical protein